MPTEEGGAPPPRKVRSACRRCRQKRAKCDGGIPACGNCARAKVSCIDVHTGNNDLSIPRDFAVKCCARIKWLEENLATLCPDFDLSRGPKVNTDFMEALNTSQDGIMTTHTANTTQVETSEPHIPPSSNEGVVNKRSHSAMESDADSPLSAKARSVAIDLGMLSLQSDSRQKHYLGSSSGLLFAKLMSLDNEQLSDPAAIQKRRLTPQRISDEIYKSLYSKLRKELPSPEEACLLLEIYFQNIHIDYPFLHPASIINAYRALYVCAETGYDESVDQNGWISSIDPFGYNGKMEFIAGRHYTPISIFTAVFHCFTVFSLSATILTRQKIFDHSPSRFQRMAMSAASETFSSISIPSLQAVLLLTVQSLIEPAGMNVWTLSCIAMSHCIDLGLQREPGDSDIPGPTKVLQRFLFYTVYSMDRSIATIQGRPLGIRDEAFDIRLPDESDVTAMMTLAENDLLIKLPETHLLTLSILRFRLEQHISEIKLLLYHLPTRNHSFVWPTNLTEIQEKIKFDLDNWLADVDQINPAGDLDEEQIASFQIQKMRHEQIYHSAICLLFQPSQMFPSPSQEALRLCYQSCSRRLQIYDAVSSRDMLYYNWRNIHGIFSSGATIVYCAWASRDLQQTVPFAKLLRDLRTCSNHLSIGSQWWPSVRNGKESFEVMIDLIIKYFSDVQMQVQDLSTPQQKQRFSHNNRARSSQVPSSNRNFSGAEHHPANMDGAGEAQSDQFHLPQQDQSFDLDGAPPSLDQIDLVMSMNTLQEFDPPTIEAAMENFMADYLHEDWGWDPFSNSTGLFDQANDI
ncbi:hypothetical protein N7450_009736 [Penicillium hetheringtonii]|uniref:Zn(2)-C6 fungal-type domain-containing protein n=1 Tax=Penicillium hetheringtonii TaxID=911720 RepID=A0AAD6GLR5_9EURO|nr:hypothetical protein N7450_009736 [Penicillium hetheringtonii]